MDATFLSSQLSFSTWATRRTLSALGPLSEHDFTRDLGTSHGSLQRLLTHMFSTEWYFFQLMTGAALPLPDFLRRESTGASLPVIRAAWEELMGRYEALTQRLSDPAFAAEFAARPVEIHGATLQAWQCIVQVVNHATYHRGQVASLLRQMGRTPISSDIIQYYFEAEGKRWPF